MADDPLERGGLSVSGVTCHSPALGDQIHLGIFCAREKHGTMVIPLIHQLSTMWYGN